MGNACNKTSKKPYQTNNQNQNDFPPPAMNSYKNVAIPSNISNTNQISAPPPPPNSYPLANPQQFASNNLNNNTNKLNITPQDNQKNDEKIKDYWDLHTFDEIFQRLTSFELNQALKTGQNLSVILDVIPLTEPSMIKDLCLRVLLKLFEQTEKSTKENPEELIRTIILLKEEVFLLLKEYDTQGKNTNSEEIFKDCKNLLELIVEFYQVSYGFLYNTIKNMSEKWWTLNKNDDMLEIYYIKFKDVVAKINEKKEGLYEKTDENVNKISAFNEKTQENVEFVSKSPKLFINIDIEQEFMKVGANSFDDIWENCEVLEETEGICLRINSQEYIPKVKRKKQKKNNF